MQYNKYEGLLQHKLLEVPQHCEDFKHLTSLWSHILKVISWCSCNMCCSFTATHINWAKPLITFFLITDGRLKSFPPFPQRKNKKTIEIPGWWVTGRETYTRLFSHHFPWLKKPAKSGEGQLGHQALGEATDNKSSWPKVREAAWHQLLD